MVVKKIKAYCMPEAQRHRGTKNKGPGPAVSIYQFQQFIFVSQLGTHT